MYNIFFRKEDNNIIYPIQKIFIDGAKDAGILKSLSIYLLCSISELLNKLLNMENTHLKTLE